MAIELCPKRSLTTLAGSSRPPSTLWLHQMPWKPRALTRRPGPDHRTARRGGPGLWASTSHVGSTRRCEFYLSVGEQDREHGPPARREDKLVRFALMPEQAPYDHVASDRAADPCAAPMVPLATQNNISRSSTRSCPAIAAGAASAITAPSADRGRPRRKGRCRCAPACGRS